MCCKRRQRKISKGEFKHFMGYSLVSVAVGVPVEETLVTKTLLLRRNAKECEQ